jgi:inhibitor of KinA
VSDLTPPSRPDWSSGWKMVPAGDSVLIVELEARIDPEINARAVALAETVASKNLAGIRDVVPTYCSVAIYFDPLHTDYDRLVALLEREASQPAASAWADREPVRIPVCYGGDLGPDLSDVASFAHLSEEEVIDIHSSSAYRVFMLGFVAGFAYMGTVDDRIAMPRHATPRRRVPIGSVGIAGRQTGVYPAETPGGWQIIGRTPIKPFDPTRAEPFLMKAGDMVRFDPIDRADYDRAAADRRDAWMRDHRRNPLE